MEEAKKFGRCLARLLKEHGPQGWWPRIVVHETCDLRHGEYVVRHHPGPKASWLSRTRADQAFEVAIGAILTQNTAWTNVEKALVSLAAKGLTTSHALSRTRLPSIESCVRSSGYYRQKAKKLKLFAKFVEEELGGDFGNVLTTRRPERSSSEVKDHLKKISLKKVLHSGRRTASVQDDLVSMAREKLLSLWGIGPETADTILLYGLGCPVFVVDAYTRRFLSRLTGDASWSKRPYDEARRFCESALVESTVEDLQEAHALIVRWGKDSNPGDRLVV